MDKYSSHPCGAGAAGATWYILVGEEVRATILVCLVFYVGLAFVFFFFPLWTTHDAMKDQKEEYLLKIAKRLNAIHDSMFLYVQTIGQAEQTDSSKLRSFNEASEELYKLYTSTEGMPVWPFDTRTITRFLGTVSIPVVMFAIERVAALIS